MYTYIYNEYSKRLSSEVLVPDVIFLAIASRASTAVKSTPIYIYDIDIDR